MDSEDSSLEDLREDLLPGQVQCHRLECAEGLGKSTRSSWASPSTSVVRCEIGEFGSSSSEDGYK